MLRLKFALAIGFAVCIFFGWIQASVASDGYVLSKQANILLRPEFGSPILITVKRGTKLELKEGHGNWVMVRTGQVRGWVPQLLVDENPPAPKPSKLEALDGTFVQSTRRRASEVTAAGATRGLTAQDRLRASQEDVADFVALGKVESWSVTEAEISQFAQPLTGSEGR